MIAHLPAPQNGLTVLIYHRVGGSSGGAVDLDPARFSEQMLWLRSHREIVSLGKAVDSLRSGDPVAGQVVVTFDDGTADFADHAVPVLVATNTPATLYVATDFVDRNRPFPWGAPPLSWAALRDAVSTGLVTVGSHTHTHKLLDRLDPGAVAGELDRSIERIGAELGAAPDHFAYPKAVAGSATAEAAVRARFRSAALAGTRPNRTGRTDVHRLARSPIQRSDGMEFFIAKAQGRMWLEDDLRRAANRIRYRNASE
jgi:peptidoglycan/xylan/chitin deacetylase (PgdA/CDA1 family)